MDYKSWFLTHGEKHKAIMDKLSTLSDEEVIEYFRFDNMVKNEPAFCLLYQENKKCHNMPKLNCYLCACPSFRFDDDGLKKVGNKTLFSSCDINAKDGSQFISEDAIHHDCTGCLLPHHESYIKKVFKRDWFEVMREVSMTK